MNKFVQNKMTESMRMSDQVHTISNIRSSTQNITPTLPSPQLLAWLSLALALVSDQAAQEVSGFQQKKLYYDQL
jgi:hypothetical protein